MINIWHQKVRGHIHNEVTRGFQQKLGALDHGHWRLSGVDRHRRTTTNRCVAEVEQHQFIHRRNIESQSPLNLRWTRVSMMLTFGACCTKDPMQTPFFAIKRMTQASGARSGSWKDTEQGIALDKLTRLRLGNSTPTDPTNFIFVIVSSAGARTLSEV